MKSRRATVQLRAATLSRKQAKQTRTLVTVVTIFLQVVYISQAALQTESVESI